MWMLTTKAAFKAILPRTATSGHPLSSQALNWILERLEECKNSHVSCKKTAQALVPKRLIRLTNKGSRGIEVKLIESKDQKVAYAALSHCWGTHQTCITTKETLADRKADIPWSTIPKTFKDVMILALNLGIRHIWIDSLCIIQDDEEDWEIESSLMAEVYRDAVLTIAATSSAGDEEGCCLKSQRVPDLEVTLPDDIGAHRIAVRKPHKHWDTQTAKKMVKHFPLLTRGWAFQERLLSPRVLHLCESELVWECRERSICECGGLSEDKSPGGAYYHAVQANEEEKRLHELAQQRRMENEPHGSVHWDHLGDLPPTYEDAILNQETAPGSPSTDSTIDDPVAFISQTNIPIYEDADLDDDANTKDCPELVFHFHRIVEQYSQLRLTRQSDRLPALSGLCKRVQHLRNNYLAGLWSDSICYDLLWRVETIDFTTPTRGARPPTYNGPTWSWISTPNPVKYWPNIQNFRPTHEGFPVSSILPDGSSMYMGWEVPKHTIAAHHVDKFTMSVNVPGKNPFGTVSSAILTIEASATTALLRYTYDAPQDMSASAMGAQDPMRYALDLKVPAPFNGPEERVEIPFFADYALAAEGLSRVPANAELTMLLIHGEVCLVLRRGSTMVNGEKAWERVGIARLSDALARLYRIDWMRGSVVGRFCIV